jgi:hypothetical protein
MVGSEPAAVLRQNMVPGHDSRIGYTFTPGVGPHWSMTGRLSPKAKVKQVKPFHRWDWTDRMQWCCSLRPLYWWIPVANQKYPALVQRITLDRA